MNRNFSCLGIALEAELSLSYGAKIVWGSLTLALLKVKQSFRFEFKRISEKLFPEITVFRNIQLREINRYSGIDVFKQE